VTVTIAGQTLTALLQANGTWNATPTHVGEGTWEVSASVPDPAGNVGNADQTLVIGPEDDPPPVEPPPPPVDDPTPAAGDATVSGNASQRVRGRSFSIRAMVTAPASSGALAMASGRVKIKGAKRIKLAAVSVRVRAGLSGQLNLRPKGKKAGARKAFKRIKSAFASRRRVLAVIPIWLVNDDGGARLVTKRVLLKR
jgi:hypothetical protein